MANTERLSVSISKARAADVRELVANGAYPSVSSAVDAAVEVLLDHEAEKAAWWAETLRRCEEAEKHPERLLDFDTFRRNVRSRIDKAKASGQLKG